MDATDAAFAAAVAKANAAAADAASALAKEKEASESATATASAVAAKEKEASQLAAAADATQKAALAAGAAPLPPKDDGRLMPMCKVATKAGRRKNGKAVCGSEAQELHGCCNNVCQSFVHPNCSARILNYGDIPMHERPAEPKLVFCTVACHRKFESKQKAEQKKIEKAAKDAAAAKEKGKVKKPWDADDSLHHLMDWLTAEPNFSHCCGGEGNDGKSKAKHHKDLVIVLKEKVPGFDRSEKDAKNKIEKLASQFNVACDWMGNTGAGLKAEGKFDDTEAHINKICPHCCPFEDVMGDRPSARLLVNSDAVEDQPFTLDEAHTSDEEEEDDDDGLVPAPAPARTAADMATSPVPALPVLPPMNLSPLAAAPAAAAPIAPVVPAPVVTAASTTANNTPQSSVTTSTTSAKKKKQRLTAPSSSEKKNGAAASADDLVNKILGGAASSLSDRAVVAKEREADANERMADAKEREADARMLEAKASDKKLAAEAELLSDDVACKRLMKRKQALAEGLCGQEELDAHFPMPQKK